MIRRGSVVALLLILALVIVPGCGDDDKVVEPQEKESRYKDLSEPWHVLNNLEAAFDDRNIDRYAALFDQDNFVFHFLPLGGSIPDQWGYVEEYSWTNNFFSGVGDNPLLSIDVTIHNVQDATWTEIADTRFPGETLLQTTVYYEFDAEFEDGSHSVAGKENVMRVIVRDIGGKWMLVTWVDLGKL